MTAYSEFEFTNGLLFDYTDNQCPTKLYAWTDRFDAPEIPNESTFFGFIFEGEAKLKTVDNQYNLIPQQYFSTNSTFSINGGRGILIERIGYKGMNMIGGPVESWGRLKYIDGCTDSLLIPPVKLGDPCFNALFFPPNTDQTAHTHPSMRVGMVIRGAGTCVTPEKEYDLVPGKIFIIHEEGMHKFKTNGHSQLVVVAYHPDSDFGPVDEDHPMINRTLVDGISAAKIDEIRTR